MTDQSLPDDVQLDVCGLEPPEPMAKVMDALSLLERGKRLCLLIDREPRPLFRILDNNGFRHAMTARPDGLFEILIWHQA